MSPSTEGSPWGELVQNAVADSIESWRRQYGIREEDDGDPRRAITGTELQLTFFPGGYAVAIITIRSRRKWNDQSYLFRLARVAGGKWVVAGTTLP
jgi:hypothetical protein